MLPVGVVGASGYSGIELVRLLLAHPHAQLMVATSQANVGRKLSDLYPQFLDSGVELVQTDIDQLTNKCQLVFLCLPHSQSAELAAALYRNGVGVIDLSADFRLDTPEPYLTYYDWQHPCPELLGQAVYGLPELHRAAIAETRLLANPGCYATGALLGLIPLFKANLKLRDIIVDSKSGVSGAGRKPELAFSVVEATESVRAYKVASHRHQPEILSQLQGIADHELRFSFTPHLMPMKRGILSTIYVQLAEDELGRDFKAIYRDFYLDEPFVRVLDEGQLPQTRSVCGTNNCHLSVVVDKAAQRLIIITALDNLLKGASGQAVQNFNLMQGFPEKMGLTSLPPLF